MSDKALKVLQVKKTISCESASVSVLKIEFFDKFDEKEIQLVNPNSDYPRGNGEWQLCIKDIVVIIQGGDANQHVFELFSSLVMDKSLNEVPLERFIVDRNVTKISCKPLTWFTINRFDKNYYFYLNPVTALEFHGKKKMDFILTFLFRQTKTL